MRRRGEHRPSGENVLDDLLAATHEDGSPLGDREVRDALITILIAGHDTTALALAWALADIVPRPEIVDRYVSAGAKIYRTDYEGALTLDFGVGAVHEPRREREHDAHYWREVPRRGELPPLE